ncbi:TonB-dependent receptor domain-containing protein [Teredinibacter franksiae]|uniref:TonB-dependent receptor domain-containing protein n=1 Tax=Teredinibacter franksiae TaxID=2761453 RepID=UPI001C8A14FB|nr:TonB-dependent receptor [Teredinibacter franksiae]
MCQRSYLLVSTALLMALSASGAIAEESNEEGNIEETLIWGTRIQASSLNLDMEALSIKQADHISDLLRSIPGVDVGGAHSLNQRITIRSMDDKDLRITIDGANQNTYMYHHMGNLQIHADILSAVDVEVGSNSVVNGGLGGAVRFETKNARDLLVNNGNFGGRAQLHAGTNSSQNYSLTGYGLLGESVDVLVYYNDVSRKNYDVGGSEILDANGAVIDGTDGTVRGLEGDLYDALIKVGWEVAPGHTFKLGYESYNDKGDYSYRPDMGLATDLAITNSLEIPLLWPTEFTRDTLTLNYLLEWGEHTNLRASLFSNESELTRDESGWADNEAFAASAATVTGMAKNSGLNILAETELGNHLLTWGGEQIRYETSYLSEAIGGGEQASSEQASNLGLFLQDRISLGDKFAVIPGVRYDSFDIDSVVVSETFSQVSTALAGEYQVIDSLLLKLSGTQLFKGPEIGEVFVGAGLSDTANPDIEAETGLNTELSLAYSVAALGADRFSAGFTLFQTDINGYIYDYAPPPAEVGGRAWKDNIGDMAIEGFEAYVGYELGGLSALVTYSSAESELSSNEFYSDLDGARLDRQQGDTLSINLDYSISAANVVLHWDLLQVTDVDAGLALDSATLDTAKDGFTVHNISARWRPAAVDGINLIFGIDNVFDEFYASQSSRTGLSVHPRFGQLYLQDYEPGRNVKATITYAF